MEYRIILNGTELQGAASDNMLLIDFLRQNGCLSVRRGCDTSNCGCCTVLMDGKPILSCSLLFARANGHRIDTLEGLQTETADIISYFANEGADQCGFCNPGYLVNIVALLRENPNPTDEEIQAYLVGNLCRCTGYQSHIRALRKYLNRQKQQEEANESV